MTRRGAKAFVDALIAGRRPPGFRANPEELELLRTAIELSAARPGEDTPDTRFVTELFDELAASRDGPAAGAKVIPLHRRGRAAVVSLAAAAALVAGTAAITDSVAGGSATRAAVGLPGHQVLTGSFRSADDRDLGQITVYGGNPSWVFMNVRGSGYDGTVTCLLMASTGTVTAQGMFTIKDGAGYWSRPLPDGVQHLSGAKLVTANGAVLAVTTFSKAA
jgi:hypothetical protein